jgi:phosphoribosylglycinamide formyltransferase-1
VKNQTRVAIFISGTGTNALNLMRYFQNHECVKIALIFSTRSNARVKEIAGSFNVNFIEFTNSSNLNWQDSALIACQDNQIDFIVLAGFLKKVPFALIECFPNQIINIHPSLLPKFGGKGMYGKYVHEAVISACEVKSGITIHFVNEAFDEGKIIAQFETVLTESETSETLADKIHLLEMEYLPIVLEKLLS